MNTAQTLEQRVREEEVEHWRHQLSKVKNVKVGKVNGDPSSP